jgi:hypothetical protein
VAEVEEEEEELPSWLVEEPVAEAPPVPEPVAEPPAPEPVVEKVEEEEEEAPPLPAWLETPADTAVDVGLEDFLKAAEPAGPTPPEPVSPPPAPEPVAEVTPEPAAEAPISPPVIKPTTLLPDYQEEIGEGQDFDVWLKLAREKLEAGDLNGALASYESLVYSGQMLDETITDLTELAEKQAVGARVYRTLGDALVARGRLQDGLEMFRKALDTF